VRPHQRCLEVRFILDRDFDGKEDAKAAMRAAIHYLKGRLRQ
jgi:hypothetical protein